MAGVLSCLTAITILRTLPTSAEIGNNILLLLLYSNIYCNILYCVEGRSWYCNTIYYCVGGYMYTS